MPKAEKEVIYNHSDTSKVLYLFEDESCIWVHRAGKEMNFTVVFSKNGANYLAKYASSDWQNLSAELVKIKRNGEDMDIKKAYRGPRQDFSVQPAAELLLAERPCTDYRSPPGWNLVLPYYFAPLVMEQQLEKLSA